jgi:hypothetical protein
MSYTDPLSGKQVSLDNLAGVQRTLAILGHDPGRIDGMEGQHTTNAIKAFQAAAGLGADGLLGPKTKQAMSNHLERVLTARGSRGKFRVFGDEGAWPDARAAVGHDGRVYVSYGSGKLFVVEPVSGTWHQLGSSDGWNTRLMFSLGKDIGLVEESGTLFAVNPGSGEHRQVGADGEWANVVCAAACAPGGGDGEVHARSNQGTLWTFSEKGGWVQVGGLDTWRSRLLFGGHPFVVVEESGDAFAVDPKSGEYSPIGPSLGGATTGVRVGANIVVRNGDGGVQELDTGTFVTSPVGEGNGWTSKFLLSATGGDLISLEQRGTFCQIFL